MRRLHNVLRTPLTIADIAAALRGIPRNAYVPIETADGPRPLTMVQVIHLAERDGACVARCHWAVRGSYLKRHADGPRYAVTADK